MRKWTYLVLDCHPLFLMKLRGLSYHFRFSMKANLDWSLWRDSLASTLAKLGNWIFAQLPFFPFSLGTLSGLFFTCLELVFWDTFDIVHNKSIFVLHFSSKKYTLIYVLERKKKKKIKKFDFVVSKIFTQFWNCLYFSKLEIRNRKIKNQDWLKCYPNGFSI